MSSSPSSHTEESQQQQQQQQQQSPRYWCYTCNSEVPIYMAPDPTCQRCNEQFIEEIDSENDPQSFLAGAPATNTSTADSQAQSENAGQTGDNQPHQAFFRYETGDDDDIFHFFAPMDGRPSTEGGLGSGGLGGTGGSDEPGNLNQQPLATMIQNLLTSMLGPAAEGMQQQQQQRSGGGDNEGTTTSGDQQPPTSTTGDREEGDNGTQSQRTPRRPTPVVFYGSMADGNMQFRPMNIPSQQNQGEGENQEGQGGDENRPPNNFAK
ncbi:hypothetical protein BDC45DRAFT_34431 [Circinella umbellata]|nr:hypothetical protein BDC45DRAFT_34431 [Circinella umbellata]